MKINVLIWLVALVSLAGCNDKPDVYPGYNATLNVSVYPNPATTDAYISVSNQNGDAFTLQVFDTRGKVILMEKGTQNQSDYKIRLQDKPAGSYQIILNTNKAEVSKKLIKI